MKLLSTLASVVLPIGLIGCASVQQFSLRDISQIEESKASSSTFVVGTLDYMTSQQNLTLWENLQWGAPAHPTNGWKYDMMASIRQVLKGHVEQKSIILHDLGPVSTSPDSHDSWPYLKTPHTYYIGWRGGNAGRLSHLILIPWPENAKP